MRARLALAEEQLRREDGFVLTAAGALAQKDAIEALGVGQEVKDAELAAARAENAAQAGEIAAQAGEIAARDGAIAARDAEIVARDGEVAAQAARIAELEALMVAP